MTDKKNFKTRELNFWQKLMQVYWFNPKSWLLDEFVLNNDMLSIKTKAGKTLISPLTELRVRIQADNYGRHEVYISHGNEKIHFKEIGFMLTDDEWEEIFDILSTVPDTDQTIGGKITSIAKKIIQGLGDSV